MFRWAVYFTFAALMLFLAVCVAVGIVANISEQYPELEVTHQPAAAEELDQVKLQECREALARMRRDDLTQTQTAFTGDQERDAFLASYREWERQWRTRFEKLGLSCRLTGAGRHDQTTVEELSEIYRRLDSLHRDHARLVQRYVTEQARPLREIRELLERTQVKIDLARDSAEPNP
jgi:hypothetical protein